MYSFNKPIIPSLWLVQEGTNLTQIEVVALKEASFLFSKKTICPLINLIGDNISTPMKQPPGCAPQNLFSDGTFALVYKLLDLDA